MTKYLLEIDDAQADVLIHAVDVYSRLHMGQAHIAIDEISLHHDRRFRTPEGKISDEYFDWRDRLKEIADVLGKTFTGMSETASFGITSNQIPEISRVAWDLYQVVRHRTSWTRHPEGRTWSCHFDEPFRTSYETGLAKCEVKQEIENVSQEKQTKTNIRNRPARKTGRGKPSGGRGRNKQG